MNCHSILTYFFLFLYIQWGFNYCPFDIKKNEINDFLYLADQILFKRVVNVCVQLSIILLMLVCISFGPLKLIFFFSDYSLVTDILQFPFLIFFTIFPDLATRFTETSLLMTSYIFYFTSYAFPLDWKAKILTLSKDQKQIMIPITYRGHQTSITIFGIHQGKRKAG